MEPIEWTDSFSVGVALFDTQHQRLIDMLNRMILATAVTTRSETVADILTDMTRYAQEHFRSEEVLMTEHNYPGLEEHRRQHNEFQEKTARLCVATAKGRESVPRDMLDFLLQWLINHILKEDMAFKPFFRAKGVR